MLLFLSAFGRVAAAEEEREPVRVEYVVPAAGCPDQARFVMELTARTSKVTVVETGERRVLRVEVARPSARPPMARVRGTLTLGADGKSATREVVGQSCAEVVSALALVAALAIDPHASTKPAPDLAPPPPSPPEPPPPAPPPEPAAPQSPPEPPAPPVPVAPPPVVRVVPPAEKPVARFALSAGVRGGARSSPLPSIAPELGGLVEGVWVRRSLLSPAARLEIYGSFSQTTPAVAGAGAASASLGWTGVRFSACPLRVVRGPIAAAGCGVVDSGLLTAHANGLADGQKDARVSVALGGSVSARWTFAGAFFLGGDVGLSAPLVRERFYAAGSGSTPGVTLVELPSLGAFGGLFLGFDLFS